MPEYSFSVIIPSYNRADEVMDLLISLQSQTLDHDRFEVLVVDDGSTDDTESKVVELAARLNFHLRFFRRDHEGPGPARNYGMSQAEGAYFLFIDSDCLADADWLKEIGIAIGRETPDAFGGPDSVLAYFTPLQKAINYSMTSFITTGGMRGHSKKRLAKFYPRSFNMGIRREIFTKLGGMGNLRHGQDLEFSRRIVASGAKVIYIPDAYVYHKRRTSLRKFYRQIFNWGVARINLSRLDGANLEPLHFMPAVGADGFVVLLILGLLSRFFLRLWLVCLALGIFLLGFMTFNAWRRHRDWRTAGLVPLVALTQIFGYGFGFTTAFVWRIILGKEEFTGFVRRYYK